MFGKIQPEKIYKHTHLREEDVAKIRPLMESAFREQIGDYSNQPTRKNAIENRIDFAARQYANRMRIARNMNTVPLMEDAAIFRGLGQNVDKLFESVSLPGNIVGMGNVSNPDPSYGHQGGIWNPGYKAGSGDIPSYIFGLQSHLAYFCIGFDLIPTVSVDTPKVTLQYVDTVYGGGTFNDPAFLPSYIEIGNKVLTAQLAKSTAKLKRATSELIFRAEDGAGKNAIKVRFMMKSTVKAAYLVEVLAVGTVDTAANGHTFTANNTLSVKAVVDSINASASAKVLYDDPANAGTWVAVALNAGTTTVDYASATRNNIAEATSNNNSFGGMSREQHRKGPKHKLNVISLDKQIEIKGIELEADTDNIQIKDMAAQGVNVIARLYNGVQNSLVQSLDEFILSHLYALGVQHASQVVASQGVNFSLYIAAPANTTKTFSSIDVEFKNMQGVDVRSDMGSIPNSIQSAGYENQNTHADRLYARILKVAEFIAYQNRIGAPDFIVLSGELASCIKKNSTYAICPTLNTMTMSPELHYTGTIFGSMNVYNNPKIDFTDPRILIGRRGDDTDPGAKFIAYDLAASRQTIVENTMAEKIRVWSRFEIADIGFYPELNYYTMVAINEYMWN